jgi:hypothetical protein
MSYNYFINGALIATVQSVKNLGVLVAVNLSGHKHVLYVTKKANHVANYVLHAFKCRNVEVYMHVFDAYVRPYIEFCNCVWNPTTCGDIDTIENVQRVFTRHVFKQCLLPRMEYCVEKLDEIEHYMQQVS